MRRCPLPLLLPLLLASCASDFEGFAERGRSELVGLTAAQLASCAGEPVATNRENGADLVTYFRELSGSAPMSADTSDRSPLARPAGDYDYFRYCEATFVLRQGRVAEVLMKGRTATGRENLSACGAIVQRCLKPRT